MEKRDSKTGERPQGNADFSGIIFEIVNSSRNPVEVGGTTYAPGQVVATLITDESGYASTEDEVLPYGTYTLRKVATNAFMLHTFTEQTVPVTEHKKTYVVTAENDVVRGGISVEKRDSIAGSTPQGNADFEGITFEVINESQNPVIVNDKSIAPGEVALTLTTDSEGKASTASDALPYEAYILHESGTNESMLNTAPDQPDEVCLTIEVKDGVAQSDVRALPCGSYTLAESKPGTGYLWTDKTIRPFDVLEDGFVKEYREGDAAYSQVKRGDLNFVKVGEKNMHRFANVAFKLTSQTTGESHILLTDANGEVHTETKWNPHTQNNNGNDDKPEAEQNDETGVWFSKTTEDWMVETQDGLYALPFDQYTLEELRCKGNESYELVTVPNITISRNTAVIELGTIDDHERNTPKTNTTAMVDGEKVAEPLNEVTIVDAVAYSGLEAGKTYKLSGVLMDKASGAPLLVDGQQITAEKDFTPESATGTEEMAFTFDASALAGKSVVVFETLYHEGKEIAIHIDITDLGQTVEFTTPDKPEIKTTATVNGEKKAEPKGDVTITDTVSYTGLTPGKTYKLSGVLMDKATGKRLLVGEKEVTAEKEFTPESAAGTEEITFSFDASALAGKSVVVFETLYHDGKEVAVHADINDEDQTIEFEEPDKPHIKTKATVDGEKEADPLEKITLIDTVTYSNLTPGKTYTVNGVLMDKSTAQKLLIDGQEISAETEFMPDKANGTVDLSFTFNASGLAGKSVVAFESLYNEGIEAVVHADIDDDDQIVVICQPKLKTTATIGGRKETTVAKEITLEDKVAYTGLTPGKEYTVKGVLMDKSTGKKFLVDGKENTTEATFTPEKSEGEVTVTFKFDGSKITAKTDIVVFETLYRDGKEIAAHTDINDNGQTVTLTPEEPKTPTPNVPKTGDDRSIALPLILLGASLAGLAVLLMLWFRGKKGSPQTGSENEGRK